MYRSIHQSGKRTGCIEVILSCYLYTLKGSQPNGESLSTYNWVLIGWPVDGRLGRKLCRKCVVGRKGKGKWLQSLSQFGREIVWVSVSDPWCCFMAAFVRLSVFCLSLFLGVPHHAFDKTQSVCLAFKRNQCGLEWAIAVYALPLH